MIRCVLFLTAWLISTPVIAQSVVATTTIRSHQIISLTDVQLISDTLVGAARALIDVVGLEAKVTLYAGRPISLSNIGPPAMIERNQIVRLVFKSQGLTIVADGRALDRAAIYDRVRVMNLSSRTTVFGTVMGNGLVEVSQ